MKVGTVNDLPPEGESRAFHVAGKTVCIANVNGEYCAMDDVCPHRGGPLGMGYVEDGKVICPWHGWQFDARTGMAPQGKAGVAIYQLHIEGGNVFVKL